MDQGTRASLILKHLQLLCTRERRHYEQLIIQASEAPVTDDREQRRDIDIGDQYVRLTQIIMGLVEHHSHLVKWLRDCAGVQFKESTWRWTFNDGAPEASENWLPDAETQPEEPALIKVYHGRDHKHLFSYWVDRNNVHSYTSVIFRYWRYLAEELGQDFDKDVDIWTEIRYVGDGRCIGKLNSHWDTIQAAHSTGILGPEPLYSKPGDPLHYEPRQDVLVLKVHVESHDYQRRMDEGEKKREEFSRLLTSQTFLDAFLDRALAYSLNCHIGIVTFNSSATLVRDFTHKIQDLHGCIESAQPGGDTCTCDALSAASHHLLKYASQYPTARKRIICLSDGLGSASRHQAQDLAKDLIAAEVVVDSVSYRANNSALQAITWLTGGDDFVPQNNDEVLAIAQLEPFLSQLQREPPPQPRAGTIDSFRTARAAGTHKPIRATPENRRLRTPYPALTHRFVEPETGLYRATKASTTARTLMDTPQRGKSAAARTHNHTVRLRAELRALRGLHRREKLYRVFVSERDISCWLVVIGAKAKDATLYNQGVWILHLNMPDTYPTTPPDVRFKTPSLHHLNVNLDGRVCHRLLYQDWSPQTSNLEIIEAVGGVLVQPRFEDAINLTAMRQMYRTGLYGCEFEDEAERQMQRYARRSRRDWARAIKMHVERLPEEGPERRWHEKAIADEEKLPFWADDIDMDYEGRWADVLAPLETDEYIRYGE